VIVCHKHKFIFIKPKKVAGTSAELFLSKFCGEEDILSPVLPHEEPLRLGRGGQNWHVPGLPRRRSRVLRLFGTAIGRDSWGYPGFYHHMPAREIRRLLGPEIWDSYFKFTIERNPWDRQVSLYHWHYRGRDNPPPFESFVANPLRRKVSPNYDIYAIDGEVAVDFVCHYHQLEDDLARVLDILGLEGPVELPRAKSGFRSGGRNWRDYYTERTKEIVGNWYHREIEAFGYSFD